MARFLDREYGRDFGREIEFLLKAGLSQKGPAHVRLRDRVGPSSLDCSGAARRMPAQHRAAQAKLAVAIEQFILDPDMNHQHQPRAIA
jgi:hypothetical protein